MKHTVTISIAQGRIGKIDLEKDHTIVFQCDDLLSFKELRNKLQQVIYSMDSHIKLEKDKINEEIK